MKKMILTQILFWASSLFNLQYGQYKNIIVNSDTLISCNEPSIALNPTNPINIVIGTNVAYFFSSFDGGDTWTEGKMYSSMGVWGDPSLVFDNDGNLYFGHLSGEPPLSGRWADRIVIQKSTDGGLTWNDGTFTGLNRPKFEDKDWISVDRSNSEYKNNLYVAWTEFDKLFDSNSVYKSRILFSRSTDRGETWSDPLKISDTEGDCLDDDNTTEGAIPAVGPNGEVYIAWAGPDGIVFDRSFDGGITFGKDIFVSEHIGGWGWGYEVEGIYGNGLPQTICDISNSPYRGTIYILWADQRNGITNPDILLKKSTDKGATWSETKIVNDDDSVRPQFFPWMCIDPVTGIIYVIYYDRRNTLGSMTEVFIAKSTDGGETFSNFCISESPFEATLEKFLGDYINIVAYNGIIYAVWTRIEQFGTNIVLAKLKESALDVIQNKFVEKYSLSQNYPNPFNPNTKIVYSITKPCIVNLKIYNILGKEVSSIINEIKPPGNYEVVINGSNLPSGVYYYRLKAGNYSDTKTMILLK